jgi:hypothetical protein
MTKEQIIGIVRHGLTFIGGILLTYGTINEMLLAELIGSGTALASVIWSIINKTPSSVTLLVEAQAEEAKIEPKPKKKRYYPKKKKEAAK